MVTTENIYIPYPGWVVDTIWLLDVARTVRHVAHPQALRLSPDGGRARGLRRVPGPHPRHGLDRPVPRASSDSSVPNVTSLSKTAPMWRPRGTTGNARGHIQVQHRARVPAAALPRRRQGRGRAQDGDPACPHEDVVFLLLHGSADVGCRADPRDGVFFWVDVKFLFFLFF